MTEAVQVALIANGTTVFVLVLSHIVFHIEHRKTAANVQKIEVATNSIKDALVLKTEQEALARGKSEGYAAGHLEGRIEGVRETRKDVASDKADA